MGAASYAAIAAVGYVLGGIPTAYLAGWVKGIDIRRHGSGNVGGTNALRILGWKVGLPVMALDVAKGYLAAALLPRLPFLLGDPTYLALAGGMGALIGHVFSPYLRLRGGKGVAAGAGILLALAPLPTGIAAGAFLLFAFGTGIVSVGSLAAAATLPLATFLLHRYAGVAVHPAVQGLAVGLFPFVVWTHRTNVRRLLTGKENRFRRPWERPRSPR